MNERERIIELVKKGVLSTEEGLDLIEGIAKKENKQMENKEFSSTESNVEEDIENLATDINNRSAKVDSLNSEIADIEADIQQLESELEEATKRHEGYDIQQLEADVEDLKEEKRLIREMDEVDNFDELKVIDQEIDDKMKEIDSKEVELQESNDEIEDLTMRITELSIELDELMDERDRLVEEMNGAQSDGFSKKLEDLKKQFHISEEWKTEASDTMNKAGEHVGHASKEINRVFKDLIDSSKSVLDNFEWKKHELKVPTLVSESFTKSWTISEYQPTILDFKNANGNIIIEAVDSDEFQIDADITMYGKLDTSVEDAFEKRSIYKVDEDRLVLHVPNKRIKADITVKLPQLMYDYVSINVLNGDIDLSHVSLNDLFVKSVNSDIKFEHVQATMAEIKGSNSKMTLKDVTIQDLIANSVSGDISILGDVLSSTLTTTNGNIRATLVSDDTIQFEGTSVNGDVKVALPKSRDIEAEGKTTFGKVYSRLSDVEEKDSDDDKTEVQFSRINEGNAVRVKAKTTRGNILFKDSI